MGSFHNITSADGFDLPVYMARPTDSPKGAIVVMQDVQAAIDFAAKQLQAGGKVGTKVGIVGYCWGGLLALKRTLEFFTINLVAS